MKIDGQQAGDGMIVVYPIYFTNEIIPEESSEENKE